MVIDKRKGDVTISTIILIVLGLAVLVMLIIGFTKGWDFFFGTFDNAPSELQTFAKACALYAHGTLRIDFCSYKLVGNDIVNCRDPRVMDSLNAEGVNTDVTALDCDDIANKPLVKKDACTRLAPNKPDTTINRDEKCSTYLAYPTGSSGAPAPNNNLG